MTTATKYKPYPKYKPSGIDWLGDIPEGWEMKKLKHTVKELVGGGTPDTGNDQNWTDDESGTPWVNIADMTNAFHIQETEKRVTESGLAEKNLKILPKNTLLYSMYASLGKVASLDIEAVTNQAILGVVEDKHKAVSDFIKWWLISIESHLSLFSTSSTQNNLNEFKVKNMPLFLPSLPQQQAITDFLDRETTKIDEVVEKKQKLVELLKEKRQAIISQAVTKGLDPKAKMKPSGIDWLGDIPERWEVKKIKHIAKIVLGKMLQNEDWGGDELKPYLRAQNILWEKVDTTDFKEMWLSDYEQKQYRVQIGDLLVSEGGEVGRTAVWDNEISECYIQNSVHKVTVNNRMNNFYLLYLLEIYGKNGYLDSIVNRVSIGHLTREKLKEIEILVPSKDEQKGIADYVARRASEIDELIRMIKLQIQKLREFRQALISNVVTGKIKV